MILSFICFDLAFTSEKSISCILKYFLNFISFLGNSIFYFWIMIFICLAFFYHAIIFVGLFFCAFFFHKFIWVMDVTLFCCSFLLEIRLFVVCFWHLAMTHYFCGFLTQTSRKENLSTAGENPSLVMVESLDWLFCAEPWPYEGSVLTHQLSFVLNYSFPNFLMATLLSSAAKLLLLDNLSKRLIQGCVACFNLP